MVCGLKKRPSPAEFGQVEGFHPSRAHSQCHSRKSYHYEERVLIRKGTNVFAVKPEESRCFTFRLVSTLRSSVRERLRNAPFGGNRHFRRMFSFRAFEELPRKLLIM